MSESAAPEAMRAARRLWPSGVTVVCTHEAEGFRGATVAAFSFVSLTPPLVLICLDELARMARLIPASGRFTVSLLTPDHEFLAERFAGRAPLVSTAFAGVRHAPAPSGLPVLAGALAWLDCTVTATHPGGDHVIIVGEVTALASDPDADPLLYFDGAYRALARE